ncbi:MAG: DNA repair protein RecO [Bacteroidota bacterium]
MILSTKGIIINKINYSESSIIVRIFTQQLGLQSYIVNGVRKSKSKTKAAIFQPLTIVDMVVYHKENSNLHHLKEIKISFPYNTLHSDIRKSCVVMFLSEMIYKSIREQEKNNELFEYIYNSLTTFDSNDELIPIFHIFFLSRLSRFLGFYPKLNHTQITPFFNPIDGLYQSNKTSNMFDKDQSVLFYHLFEETEMKLIHFSRIERMQILERIVYFYGIHLHSCKDLHSLDIYKEIFE